MWAKNLAGFQSEDQARGFLFRNHGTAFIADEPRPVIVNDFAEKSAASAIEIGMRNERQRYDAALFNFSGTRSLRPSRRATRAIRAACGASGVKAACRACRSSACGFLPGEDQRRAELGVGAFEIGHRTAFRRVMKSAKTIVPFGQCHTFTVSIAAGTIFRIIGCDSLMLGRQISGCSAFPCNIDCHNLIRPDSAARRNARALC